MEGWGWIAGLVTAIVTVLTALARVYYVLDKKTEDTNQRLHNHSEATAISQGKLGQDLQLMVARCSEQDAILREKITSAELSHVRELQ